MARNKELKETIVSLSDELGEEVATLSEKKEAKALEVKPTFYVVAKGKSLTSKKGILGEGVPVEASFFEGEDETFTVLKERFLIVKG